MFAHAVDDSGGFEVVLGQRAQVRRLLGEHVQRGALALRCSRTSHTLAIHHSSWRAKVVLVGKRPFRSGKLRPGPQETALHHSLVVGVATPAGVQRELVVGGEIHKRRLKMGW